MSRERRDRRPENHPLHDLERERVCGYGLRLGDFRRMRLSGWRGFSLFLENGGVLLEPPVVRGIYSAGAKHRVRPWMDIVLAQRCRSAPEGEAIDLAEWRFGQRLFEVLSGLIPPGGHLMMSYEEEEPMHVETSRALARRVPPAATAIGELLFAAGFRLVKDWYLAEGGHEGPRKLWGEKPLDEEWRVRWDRATAQALRDFLGGGRARPADLERARRVLKLIDTQ